MLKIYYILYINNFIILFLYNCNLYLLTIYINIFIKVLIYIECINIYNNVHFCTLMIILMH
jgi:hypothetical protein